jgi:hypothetical protein
MVQVRNDGVLEKRFEQRFPLDLALYKNPLLVLLLLLLLSIITTLQIIFQPIDEFVLKRILHLVLQVRY